MIVDELRSLLRAHPFRPFAIFTADGQEILVPHHDYAWVLPMGAEIHVQQFDGRIDHINVSQITRLNYQPQPESVPQGTTPRT